MEETEKVPEKKIRRPKVYSGEGYVPGEKSASRRQRRPEEKSAAPKTLHSSSLQEKLELRRKRKVRRVFYCLGAVFAAAYIAVAVYFSFHFYNDTYVYGIDCSHKTVSEVKAEVENKLSGYVLEIQERQEKTETISASQIDLRYVDNGGIDRTMKEQKAYIWPVMMLLEPGQGDSVFFSYDRSLAQSRINALECMNSVLAIAPRNAYIEATDTGFEVASEIMGTTLDQEKTKETVLSALDRGAVRVSLDEEKCYIDPEIYQDNEELQSDAAAMSELAKASIIYTFGDEREIVNAALIRDWIVELTDGSFVIDDMCVTNYVESLAAKYDTFGLPLDFYTSIGTTVTLAGGDYGWCIDQDATVVELLNALASGYRGEMEPVYLYSAMSHDNQGIGYTYVEICISQQRMWCYQDGNLIVDTPVVTGNPNKGNATPSGGVWAIDAKKRDAILTGEGYTSPVDYWMPFNGDVGIHDMQQRAYFGGSIYLTNGSHGCVNTPYDQVQIIYNAVSIGTPVIVYE
ncbi:MAG: L,D-transpeptidase family protein [Lachnospiraceae bacterium]|nr:L,D-transpeptidase family protein [Lachnospiraceae bacterium]